MTPVAVGYGAWIALWIQGASCGKERLESVTALGAGSQPGNAAQRGTGVSQASHSIRTRSCTGAEWHKDGVGDCGDATEATRWHGF